MRNGRPDTSAEPDRPADTGVGNRHDDVGVDRGLARQLAPHGRAGLVHAEAEDIAVGPREVDVLEDAVRDARRRERPEAANPVMRDHHHLARLDVTNVGGANQIQGARLGTDDRRVAQPADDEWPESVRVARRDQLVVGEDTAARTRR